MRTHYEILGVPADADVAQIKSQFRKLAQVVHSDRSQQEGADNLFLMVEEARRVLLDPQLRADYDAELRAAENQPTLQAEDSPSPVRDQDPGNTPTDKRTSYNRYPGTSTSGTSPYAHRAAREVRPREPMPHLGLIVFGGMLAICGGFWAMGNGLLSKLLFWVNAGDRTLQGGRYDPSDTSSATLGVWIVYVVFYGLPTLVVFVLLYSFKVSRNGGASTRASAIAGLVVLFLLGATWPILFAPIGYRGTAITWLVLGLLWAYYSRAAAILRRAVGIQAKRSTDGTPSAGGVVPSR